MADTAPRRRRSDRGWRRIVRENAYRDVWLLLVTGFVAWALISFQNERWNNVRNGCEANNQRFAGTIRELDRQVAKLPPARKVQARASKAGTIALIKQLAPPHFDGKPRPGRPYGSSTCNVIADRAVSRWP